MRKKLSYLIVVLLTTLPLMANEFVSDESHHFAPGDTINGDLFYAGGQMTFKGYAPSDIWTATETSRISGEVYDDLFGFSRLVIVDGIVGGNVFNFAETIEISGHIKGDLFAFGQNVKLVDGAVVEGNVFSGSQRFYLSENSTIKGSLHSGAETAELQGTVGGSIELHLQRVEFGPEFSVGGEAELTLPEDYKKELVNAPDNLVVKYEIRDFFLDDIALYWGMISAVVIGLLLLALFPELHDRLGDLLTTHWAPGAGIGLAFLIATPIVIVLAIAVYPLAFILTALYAILIYLGIIITALVLGSLAFQDKVNKYISYIISVVVLYLLMAVPYLGGLFEFLAIILGSGLLIIYFWTLRKGKWQTA